MSIADTATKQYIRVGGRQLELPAGVSVAEWSLEKIRVQNPCIRSYLGCIRVLEQVLESNYAILHCSPRRLLDIWRKVRKVCHLMRSELEPTLEAPSLIPELDTARRNAFYAFQVLSTTVLQDIEAYPTRIPSKDLPAIRRLLCLSIGKIYSFLRDTFGEVVASDLRSTHDSDYFLSRRFPQEIEEAEWLYATVDRLGRDLENFSSLWRSQLSGIIEILDRDRMLPSPNAWGEAAAFLEPAVTELADKLREILTLPGIRFDEMEPLDHYAFEIPHNCQSLLGVYLLGRETIDLLKLASGNNFAERQQSIEDLSACHAAFSAKMVGLLSQIDQSIRDLSAYLPLWIDNIESRRALMLTKPPQTPERRGDKLAKTLKFR